MRPAVVRRSRVRFKPGRAEPMAHRQMGMQSSIRRAPAATLRRLAHLQRLLEPGAIRPVYQPIVRVADLEPIGYEGLARFPVAAGLTDMGPDVTLAAASAVGLRGDLEVACWAAMATAGSPPGGRLLFVNISPDTLAHPGLFALATQLPSRLVIEITEQHEVQDYGELRRQLAPWIARGAQIAIDDTGAGYASLEHVVELRPDFLKLTRGLVADIDHDANRQALLRALGAFAREVGAVVVAEGVERVEELEVLRECEVDFAQGWLFGRPGAPWPEVPGLEAPDRAMVFTDSGIVRLDRLEHELAGATGHAAAAAAVVDHLHHVGLVPSVYLEQGARLRCVASRGYWAVHDGLPAGTGVIGRAFATGEPVHVEDVASEAGYLAAVRAVQAELCVPVTLAGRVAGVVDVESLTPIGPSLAGEVERAAALLARRLAELGPPAPATPGQVLARAAARAAGLDDPDAVVREGAAAALEVSGMESVLVALADGEGGLGVRHAAGPFAEVLGGLDAGELAAVAAWVRPGTTMRTTGDAAGKLLPGSEPLRRAGAGALAVVPLVAGSERLGLLGLADRSCLALDAERTELLELLGLQLAAQLRGLAATGALRDRDARDPLTGLRHAAAFHARLPLRRRAAAADGRALAVVLAAVDGLTTVNDAAGHGAGDELLRRVAGLLEAEAPEGAEAFRVDGDVFALLVDAEARAGAQGLAWHLQAQAREHAGSTLSIGVAVAGPGEPDAGLIERARRALREVERRGRDGVALAPPRLTA